MSGIGETLDALMATVEARKGTDPKESYTASLLSAGRERCAKKLGEEAVEAALAGALGQKDELAAEAADVLYHLAVLLAANEIGWDEVAAKLAGRTGQSGHEEKATR
ncbi:phosphoribosyl-ATP diphosphatase [Parvularcula dongshanensis]|uniref:Phosphoribosyl-ATP pyrophosphatase n=1 Tax=Parvularcula dongshanensis TaxID=1173995 RepID=A0A840I724_9PROT|nr:phosphoribosyl-ATP diphosphatase [Parvularcula dongshanensis]MBB4659974.1 phosphoribosyl-ATP pyrophosphohydrolase [Parvularcula dongshanensis]